MSATADDRSAVELQLTQQRTVRRSPLFARFPLLIIALLMADVVWETIRINVTHVQFVVMERSVAYALIGVGASLLLTRLQWARAMRPALGIGIDPEEGQTRQSTSKWILRIVNAGPGVPVIEKFDYYISFDSPESVPGEDDFIDFLEVSRVMKDKGLESEVDYYFKYFTRGGPLPISNYTSGREIAWIKQDALPKIKRLDIRVRVVDIAGDTHERVFPCMFFLAGVMTMAGAPLV